MNNQIDTIYITYKDRFIRFGYDWFERLCKMHNTKIVVLNNVETSPTQEMIDDMVSIVHVFSCRLSGLRKYKHKLENDKSLKGGENDGVKNPKVRLYPNKTMQKFWMIYVIIADIAGMLVWLYGMSCTKSH